MTARAHLLAIPSGGPPPPPDWQWVGVGTSVQSTTTAHTLTEPAGVQAGDLLVACISSRIASTVSITLPAGWSLVSEQKTNNTTATATSAIASGMMAYIVRGASAPALTFTHPTAPSVALGRIVAYRGVNQSTPFEGGDSYTGDANATTATIPGGVTTANANDLLVTCACGGQEATWVNMGTFDMASSGTAADETNNPNDNDWSERCEAVTTTGGDTSLAIFDAVRPTAGSTTSMSCVASITSRHVLVCGRFRIDTGVPASYTAFDPAKSSANNTLSNSNRTVLCTVGGVYNNTASVDSFTTEKIFVSFLLEAAAGGNSALGIGNASVPWTTPTSYWLGSNNNSTAIWNDGVYVGGTRVLTWSNTVAAGTVVDMAIDGNAKLAWFRVNGGNWNNSGTANPATGTEGISFSASTGPFFAAVGLGENNGQLTANFGQSAWTYAPPSGFTTIGA